MFYLISGAFDSNRGPFYSRELIEVIYKE